MRTASMRPCSSEIESRRRGGGWGKGLFFPRSSNIPKGFYSWVFFRVSLEELTVASPLDLCVLRAFVEARFCGMFFKALSGVTAIHNGYRRCRAA